jgi:hypothetical protein
LIESDPQLQDHDFLCPVPLHRVRKRERGYNQSELIAYAASVISGMPYAEPLKRRFYTRSQTLLSRAKRHKNLLNAFKVINANDVKGKRIIVVDDVFTTGSTLNEIAKTLLAAGAGKVTALTVPGPENNERKVSGTAPHDDGQRFERYDRKSGALHRRKTSGSSRNPAAGICATLHGIGSQAMFFVLPLPKSSSTPKNTSILP